MVNNVLKFSDIVAAQSRLRGVSKITTLLHSKSFSVMSDANIFLKLENMQTTGAFKVRGAYNKLACLTKEEASRGVVAASAGNHAQGVAFSASKLGMKSTIFMPIFTPPLKVLATKGYGAEVILAGESFDDAFAASQEYCKEHNATYIHPFNDPLIIAGQGTIGLEIHDQLPDANIRVIGVQAEGAASMYTSRNEHHIVALPTVNTIADGIAVKRPGDLTFDLVQQYVDEIVTVSDTEIAHTAYLLLQRAKILAEPSGVTSMAAALFKKTDIKGKNVVPLISGGNINMQILEQIVEKGMVEEGLRSTIQVIIPDQSGELKNLLSIFENLKMNIYDIKHERSISTVPIGKAMVVIQFNLQNQSQLQLVIDALKERHLECTVIA